MPSPFLGTTKRVGELDLPVTRVELEFGVSAGVQLRAMAGGMVPIYEEHEARLERGIPLETWGQMDVDEKALLIANRRIRNQLANLQAEAEIRAQKREARKYKPRGK